jgi:hypothetical protein
VCRTVSRDQRSNQNNIVVDKTVGTVLSSQDLFLHLLLFTIQRFNEFPSTRKMDTTAAAAAAARFNSRTTLWNQVCAVVITARKPQCADVVRRPQCSTGECNAIVEHRHSYCTKCARQLKERRVPGDDGYTPG